MPNPFSKKVKKRNSSGNYRTETDDFLEEGDIYALLGEDEAEDTARLKETEAGKEDPDALDLGDVLEDMTNYSGRMEKEKQENREKDPFEGLSDAEKVAKAIELAGEEKRVPSSGNKKKSAVRQNPRKIKKQKKRKNTGKRQGRKGESGKRRIPAPVPVQKDPDTRRRRVERNRRIVLLICALFCAAALLILWIVLEHHTYHSYAIVKQEKREDNVSSCEIVGGNILRYSAEGASLMDTDFDSLWNESFTMSRPKASICGNQILIYDQLGTSVYLFNLSGRVSDFETSSPILKAVISESDTVAMLLQNGSSTEFSYCESDGSVIAGGRSTLSKTGYPVDLALSPNGEGLVISYLRMQGSDVNTTLNFYNFGKSGQGRKNNLIGSDRLTGVIVPEVYYLTNRRMIAVGDNGFSVYEGTSSISAVNQVEFNDEIVSTFHDDSHLVFCFQTDSENAKYRMQTYSGAGKLIGTADLSISYEKAEVCDGQVIFHSPSEINIYNMNGYLRFSGKASEGNIGDVLKVGRNRYLIVTDQTMEIVKLRS